MEGGRIERRWQSVDMMKDMAGQGGKEVRSRNKDETGVELSAGWRGRQVEAKAVA